MILISVQETRNGFLLSASDTYIGASTNISGATIDEVMLRFGPLLRNWAELSRPIRSGSLGPGDPPKGEKPRRDP